MSLSKQQAMCMSKFEYMTAKQICECEKYPFTMGQIRRFLMFKESNGLIKAIRKIGKRMYIRTDLFDEWIESYKEEE